MLAEHAIVSKIGEIRDEIIEAIRADELVLPSMPEVSLRVREAAEDDDISVASICDVIPSDAVHCRPHHQSGQFTAISRSERGGQP